MSLQAIWFICTDNQPIGTMVTGSREIPTLCESTLDGMYHTDQDISYFILNRVICK